MLLAKYMTCPSEPEGTLHLCSVPIDMQSATAMPQKSRKVAGNKLGSSEVLHGAGK
jgi:hypothetical protein